MDLLFPMGRLLLRHFRRMQSHYNNNNNNNDSRPEVKARLLS